MNALVYGWRLRIGRITPNTNFEGPEEWYRWAPDGVQVIPAWIRLETLRQEDLRKMTEDIEEATRDLVGFRPDLIIQCCAPGTFIQDSDFDEKLVKRIVDIAGVPATTMMMSMVEAVRRSELRTIVLASPYRDDLNDLLAAALGRKGIEVLAHKGMQLLDPHQLPYMSAAGAYRLSREVLAKAPKADGILFSGGGHRTFEIIEALEADTGKPVVTGNSAAFWKVLRMGGVHDRIAGLGRLLTLS